MKSDFLKSHNPMSVLTTRASSYYGSCGTMIFWINYFSRSHSKHRLQHPPYLFGSPKVPAKLPKSPSVPARRSSNMADTPTHSTSMSPPSPTPTLDEYVPGEMSKRTFTFNYSERAVLIGRRWHAFNAPYRQGYRPDNSTRTRSVAKGAETAYYIEYSHVLSI